VRHKKFVFPTKLLEQVNECSGGGYCIFIFDEYGRVQMMNQFDSPIHADAMSQHLITWVKAVENANIAVTTQNILGVPKKHRK